MKKPYIIACIPAYNEEKTIAQVILKTKRYVDKIIVCDDGSTDMTAEIAKALGAEVIRHEKNLGYGAALRTGFEYALKFRPLIVITLDADGQHDPTYIPKLVEPIQNDEADIVIGSRFLSDEGKKEIPSYRRMGIKLITKLMKITSYGQITDAQSGFRAYRSDVLHMILPKNPGMGSSTEIIFNARRENLRIKEVPVKISYKVEKGSKKNPLSHGLEVLLSIVKYVSIKHPLMVYGVPGTFMLLIGIAFMLLLLYYFNVQRYFSLPLAILSVGFSLAGMLLCLTAILVWILSSLLKEMHFSNM